ncbi:hypothetical protein RF11_10933 [Thelohanellus kitauei]|uniref:Uncharacterized protein n=1 Tax=Thelohanellus kitauei TaxID=669202 RepID=A0A0C2IED8_THEKT|nr:hypothetical protein RF11_10933 [Thelohanellus kitauei]
MFGDIFSSQTRKELNDVSYELYKPLAQDLGGDLAGDATQTGGTICLSAEGQILFKYVQETFSDHPDLNDILKSFDVKKDLDSTPELSPIINDTLTLSGIIQRIPKRTTFPYLVSTNSMEFVVPDEYKNTYRGERFRF